MESNNQEISIDQLVSKIREEAARRHARSGLATDRTHPWIAGAGTLNSSRAEAMIGAAERGSQVRSQLPQALERFPFNRVPFLRLFILKAYEMLLREQRAINLSLIEALREILKQNRELNAGIQALKSDLARTNEQLGEARAEIDK